MSNVFQYTPTPADPNSEEGLYQALLREAWGRNEPTIYVKGAEIPLGIFLDTEHGVSNAVFYMKIGNPSLKGWIDHSELSELVRVKAAWAIDIANHRKGLIRDVTAMWEVGTKEGLVIRVCHGDPFRPSATFDFERGVALVEEIRAIERRVRGEAFQGDCLTAVLEKNLEKAKNGTA